MLKGTLDDTGVPTLLFDEPDRSLDIPLQARFWELMALVGIRRERQIIAASHSVFALGLPGVNYIEVVPGYMDKCLVAYRGAARFVLQPEGEE